MIIDASALLAIVLREPSANTLVELMAAAPVLGMGTPSVTETSIVLSARIQNDAQGLVSRLIEEFEIEPIAFGPVHWKIASTAYAKFGKGHHPAKLNFGDCMSYAIASVAEQPLLFVGEDFSKTDIQSAWK